ncbi:MAG TPA: DegT/DnrJ/EryC1/StrS family aminotransferase [Solirubrobacteraceae bacterium]|jgi:dTDP-3-amino-3,4,6-trideoxy-alpha-D-glucose transaminase
MSELWVSDPGAGFKAARAELVDAFEQVLDSGRYILGEQVGRFEAEWAARCETSHAIGVSSGTDALALALRAVGVEPGDEVLVPAMTAVATWAAVSQIGAIPIAVDIESQRNGMDPSAARGALTDRTRAIVAVHLFGCPADLAELGSLASAAGIPLVEDAAQAHGARLRGRAVGSLGAAAAFSFYPTKNLAAIGDAGAVTTSNADVADRLHLLREYGWRKRDEAELRGMNARLDELQAAILRVMLGRLDLATQMRREFADTYLDRLAGIQGLELPAVIDDSEPVWHQFVVRHPQREALASALASAGIRTAVHYPSLPPLNAAYSVGRWRPGMFPVAERHAAQALSLPVHPALRADDVERVAEAVRASCRAMA